jgi:hypothetical protein
MIWLIMVFSRCTFDRKVGDRIFFTGDDGADNARLYPGMALSGLDEYIHICAATQRFQFPDQQLICVAYLTAFLHFLASICLLLARPKFSVPLYWHYIYAANLNGFQLSISL